jgi:predicted transcriptional regulator
MGGMMKRRSKFVIILKILEISINGANKTRVVYEANLNFKEASRYLDMLISEGLIIKKGKDQAIYKTSKKGLEVLKKSKKFMDSMDSLELDISKML